MDYTASAEPLSEAIAKLNARPSTNDGGQLLDGISEAAKELEKRKAPRPVILALTVGGEEHSTLPAHHVLDNLRKSGASLHVVTVVEQHAAIPVQRHVGGGPAGREHEPERGARRRAEAVGRHAARRSSRPPASPTGLDQLADALKRQYFIEYTLPDGVKPSDKLSVSVSARASPCARRRVSPTNEPAANPTLSTRHRHWP